jgi:hypothetical protein
VGDFIPIGDGHPVLATKAPMPGRRPGTGALGTGRGRGGVSLSISLRWR